MKLVESTFLQLPSPCSSHLHLHYLLKSLIITREVIFLSPYTYKTINCNAVGSNWFVFYYNYECWKGTGTSPASFFLLGIIKRFLTTQVWQQSRFESHTCSSFLPWSRWEVFSNNYSIILSYKFHQISYVRIWTHSQAWAV